MKQQNMCIIICVDKILYNNDISVYTSSRSFTQNLCKKYSKNGTNEICCIRKSHINKYEKNKKDNKYANISSYIAQKDFMKYTIHSTNCRTKTISSIWR